MRKAPARPILAALATMTATHMLVVLASLVLPVMAPIAAASLDLPARYVGLYTTLVFLGAFVTSLLAPSLIARYGAVRTCQGAAVSAGLGLLMLLGDGPASLIASGLLVGFGYGPGNTASSWLLARFTPEGRRAGVFSIKQASVPAGSALAGILAPPLAIAVGWQGAAAILGLACIAVAVAVEPWREAFDADRERGRVRWPRRPFEPIGLVLAHPRLRALGLMAMVYSGAQFTFGAILVTFLVERAGVGTVEAGAILSAALFTSIFARVAWGYAAHIVPPAVVLGAIGVLTAAVYLVGPLVGPGWPVGGLLVLGCWFGATGYAWNGVFLASAADTARGEIAAATSGVMALVFIGSLTTPVLFTALIVALDYEAGLLVLAVLVLAAAGYVARALRPSRRP